jgi:hypothetical protein
MKLVIQTQYCENYGDEDQPHWKFKGGSTYVVQNITTAQAQRIEAEGIPTLSSLIEYSNPMSREYILDYSVRDDDYAVCEPWETPIVCRYAEGEWYASEETLNDEYGYLRSDIGRKLAVWTMLPQGERGDYTVEYYDRAGKIMTLEVLTPA